jgi:formylglycine-generating enzyme required for sulfatase activity
VTLEEGGYVPEGGVTFDVPAFTIAKYPVTNAQFAKFIEADGYKTEKWWTDVGWQTKEENKWTEPRYWRDDECNIADCPVVGVTWYEAIAFCRWLSEVSGEKIIIPTEQQWQRAAQGDDGRTYPWGNEFDDTRCNTDESGIWQTTPVTQYEGMGDSPFGVVDMIGNVWEWCLTRYGNGSTSIDGTSVRVLRGGSFDDFQNHARAASRGWCDPEYRSLVIGFRIARNPNP